MKSSAHQKKLEMCPSKTGTQMISDVLNRAVSLRINPSAALVRGCKGVTEGEVFYGVCGLGER